MLNIAADIFLQVNGKLLFWKDRAVLSTQTF